MDKTGISVRQFCQVTASLNALNALKYQVLRTLSNHSCLYLCREYATGRLVVSRFYEDPLAFQAEVSALTTLEHYAFAPKLYFAGPLPNQEQEGNWVIRSYFTGKPWSQVAQELTQSESKFFSEQLNQAINELHANFLMIHGDISPNNILISTASSFEVKKPRLCLIDWEFSGLINKENLQQSQQFQGTLGFKPNQVGMSAKQKDLLALEKMISKSLPVGSQSSWLKKQFIKHFLK